MLSRLSLLHLSLYILEYRPRCEGANFASSLSLSFDLEASKRVSIEVSTDTSLGSIAQNIDIVLLGADDFGRDA
jgi:translation initiation factor 2B subunit (eIF-2B alpha/beta/delta family)